MPLTKKILEKRQIAVEFSGLPIEDSVEKLRTISVCLSSSEVSQSLAKFGYKEVKEKQEAVSRVCQKGLEPYGNDFNK